MLFNCPFCLLDSLKVDACVYACTSQEISFSLPEGIEIEDIVDFHLTIATSDEEDAIGVAAGDMSESSDNFDLADLAELKILLGPCDLCVAGGYYYYELLATLTDGRLVPIQYGTLTVYTNLRKAVL